MTANELPDETRKRRAMTLLNQGRLEPARELLNELCRDDQGDIEIWSLHITANGFLGRYEDVIASSRKALELDAEYLPALNSLASALAAVGRHEDAAAQFASLLELAPENPSSLNNYGHCLFLMGNIDEARTAIEEAIRIQPYYAEAHYNLGILLEQCENHAEALQEFEQAASLKPALPSLQEKLTELKKRASR